MALRFAITVIMDKNVNVLYLKVSWSHEAKRFWVISTIQQGHVLWVNYCIIILTLTYSIQPPTTNTTHPHATKKDVWSGIISCRTLHQATAVFLNPPNPDRRDAPQRCPPAMPLFETNEHTLQCIDNTSMSQSHDTAPWPPTTTHLSAKWLTSLWLSAAPVIIYLHR